MQHHSAQHLLTQCFVRLLSLETVSAHINGYTPSSLDLETTEAISKPDLARVEDLANRIIYENRQVKAYFVTAKELESLPLRKPPKVSEDIRIVEIDGFDYSACGGTHVLQTGSIGIVKIIKTERQNDKIRIHFVAGLQAVELFQEYYEILSTLANQMSTGAVELPQVIQRQAEQLKAAQKELSALRPVALAFEASRLAEAGNRLSGVRLVTAAFPARPSGELRLLAEELKKLSDVIALLASYDGAKISLLVTCGSETGLDARRLLKRCLDPLGGRGGGDASLAQGGGAATFEQFQALFADPGSILRELL
jgi:alanyl-tRNA synthetase